MLSIIIPAHNEEKTIISVIGKAQQVLNRKGVDYEIIVVNDGSTDKTKALVEKEDVLLINHPYCQGYGRALKTGIERAQGEFILTIDADEQNYPEDILKLLKYKGQYDIIIGARTNTTSLARAFAKKIIFCFANYVAGAKIPDLNSGFRLIKKKVVSSYFWLLPDSASFSSTITLACIKDGYKIKFVPIKEKPRKTGKSGIRPIKDFLRFFILILRIGVIFCPLRIFLPVSIFLFISGINSAVFQDKIGAIALISISIIIFFLGLLADQTAAIRRK